jgi:dihydroorotate dehydrogenase
LNPVSLAAGFNKDGDTIDGLFELGSGWVEVSSMTPNLRCVYHAFKLYALSLGKVKPGNARPCIFHLPEDSALMNRYGFPSQGHMYLVSWLCVCQASSDSASPLQPSHILSMNLGKNKSDSITDFRTRICMFAPFAPVLMINVSSLNTPGLRACQG